MFCDDLNNVITFFQDRIISCCEGKLGPIYFDNILNGKLNISSIFRMKQKAFEMLNSDDVYLSNCNDCYRLREKKENDVISSTFNEINISHWSHCNCGCIYCIRGEFSKGLISKYKEKAKNYDMLPIVKQLYKYKLLDTENLLVRFQGGDISVLKEFESLVKEFDKQGVKEFHFLSNNIIYQPVILDMFNKKKATLVTSLDCGCKETYKRIKRVDKFDNMINNLVRYMKESDNKAKINVKYIIVPKYNDNIQEVVKFLSLMKRIGIPMISYDIDYRYIMRNDDFYFEIPETYIKIYNLFVDFCKENKICLDVCDHTKLVLKQGYYKGTSLKTK